MKILKDYSKDKDVEVQRIVAEAVRRSMQIEQLRSLYAFGRDCR